MIHTLLHRLPVFALLLAAALAGSPAAPAQEQAGAREDSQAAGDYVAGIPDLPLMPGLKPLPESDVVFDKPGGRIVEAFAVSKSGAGMTAQSVLGFYDETLPQLGWQREKLGAYLREGERLRLDLSEDAGRVTVHFRLFPD